MLKIYDEYKKYGVENYYKLHNKQYFNPHLNKIEIIYQKYLVELVDLNTSILDIACGDGLIAQLAIKYNHNRYVEGTDPYFNNKYTKYNYSFEDTVECQI
jgi:2-polyprenyl-3-methyl-5-hydroxy-6-metoxy-1,4-benzoquinol methylase